MSGRKPGIVDPWRVVDPIEPPPRQKPKAGDVDFDADLRVPGRHVIRTKHASLDVTSVRVEEPGDALAVLADCLLELSDVRSVATALAGAGIGVRRGGVTWNPPGDGVAASRLEHDDCVVWFQQKPLDEGVLVLSRILREPAAAHVMHQYGIVVMIAA